MPERAFRGGMIHCPPICKLLTSGDTLTRAANLKMTSNRVLNYTPDGETIEPPDDPAIGISAGMPKTATIISDAAAACTDPSGNITPLLAHAMCMFTDRSTISTQLRIKACS